MADAQMQIEKVEASVMTTKCRYCGGAHFSAKCPNQTANKVQSKN